MKKKLQTIIASALVVVVAAVPVFAEVTGMMTSTTVTMTTEPVVDPEPGQKLPDYFIDLKDGLKAGTDYNGITVGVDMPVSKEAKSEFTLDGETYTSLYVVQNPTDNPTPNGGKVPTAGAYVKVSPTKDGTFTVVVNQTNAKDVYFVKDGATAEVVDTFKTVANEVKVCSYEVKKGENYYFYASGSKVMIAGLGIKYSDEQKLPEFFIDLKGGLKAGTDYNGITVGVDMPVNKEAKSEFTLDGETYTSLYVVQNPTDNPTPNGGKVPTAGAYVKVSPTKDGTFTVVVNQTNAKDVYFVKDGATAEVVDTFKTVANEVKVCSYEVKKGENYYFYASGSKIMIAGLGIKYNSESGDTTVAVTDITGVATKMTAGDTITLAGTVAPANATNKTITWSIKNAGTTGATLSGDKLTAKEAGTVVVTATIAKGVSADKAFTKDFTITVEKKAETDTTVAVTGITGVATEMKAGETITLAGTVAPENATNKTIVWSVKDAGTTEATVIGDQLTAQKAGTVVVTATIEKGVSATEAYTQDFTIEVKAVVKLGDVNNDKKIDSKDALAVLQYSVDLNPSNFIKEVADVNKDKKIDSKDALEILQDSVGLITIVEEVVI